MNNVVMDMRLSMTGSVTFVSGGLGGIGRACVQALLSHGANVAFTYADGVESFDVAAQVVATAPTMSAVAAAATAIQIGRWRR